MKTLLTTLAALSLATAAAASDYEKYEKIDAAKADQIRATLTEQGYDVRKIEADDGMIEVYALKDGQRFELYLDAALNVVRTERDD